MNYQFPIINDINDVLPHIQGRPEFIVAEREDYTVINYLVNMPDTFTIDPNNPLTGLIRRECRGITFYPDGKIMSRKLQKFFNIGEIDETQPHNIDFSKPHKLLKKLDGSMLTSMVIRDEVIWCSKMGITFITPMVAAFVSDKQYYNDFARHCAQHDITPIFEFVSPDNRIVLQYDSPNLVLLAARHNVSGVYLDIFSSDFAEIVKQFNIPVVDTIEPFANVNDLIEYVKPLKGEEGFVVAFEDGYRLKIKADEYVRIHKTKDRIRSNRNIVDLMLNNELDDLIPHLDAFDVKRVRDFEVEFWKAIDDKEKSLTQMTNDAILKTNGDRKRIALEIMPNMADKSDSAIIFGVLSNKTIRDMIMGRLNKNMSADARFDEFFQWLTQ